LIDKIFDPETSMGMAGNLLVIPQVCLITRNIIEYCGKQQRLIYFQGWITLVAIGITMRYVIKMILLRRGRDLIKL
jgi:hypothetical protein